MSNIRSKRSPGREFFRQIGRSYRGNSLSRLLFRGVVQQVDRLGNEERPRFSLQIKVIGMDGPTDKTDGRWFPPLLPIQQMSLPEVGEEVILICEEIGNINSAFWISRTVSQNTLTKNEIGAGIKDQIDSQNQSSDSQYGYQGNPPKEIDQSPNEKYPIPDPRIKPGDVITQGRSNTFNRHTFDSKNSKGYVETITEEQSVPDDSFYKDDFRKSEGAREILITNSDLDTQVIEELNKLKFDRSFVNPSSSVVGYPSYDKGEIGQAGGINSAVRSKNKYDTAYLLLEAMELRIVSRQGKEVQHTVLAEEQERWLIILINLTKDLIDDIIQFRGNVDEYRQNVDNFRKSAFETHIHMAAGPTSPPLNPELTYSRGTFSGDLNTDHGHFEEDKARFEVDKADYEKHKQPIPIHHSKTVAIN